MKSLRPHILICELAIQFLLLSCAIRTFSQETQARCDNAQPAAISVGQSPEFEVVSVKQVDPKSDMRQMEINPDGILFIGYSLKSLIHFAYGINQDLILGGPKWVDLNRFDVQAKVSESDVASLRKMTRDERKAMLRSVLKERFGLTLHCEKKKLSIYELVVAKGGPKLTTHPRIPAPQNRESNVSGHDTGSMDISPVEFKGIDISMTVLTQQLQSVVQETVLDKTGLSDHYDFDLRWTLDNEATTSAQLDHSGEQQASAKADSAPSLFAALEGQLGLKLQRGRDPVETLVIDGAQLPKQN